MRSPDEDGDIDMILVMRTDLPYMKCPVAIYRPVDEFRMAADILILSPEEYDADPKDQQSFPSRIGSEKVEVYVS